MPKLKSHSGAKKRFNLTKNGKVKRAHAFKSHILTKKTTKRTRNLRKNGYADVTVEDIVKKSGVYSYVSRKLKKRDFRQLWISRISAAVAPYGINYSRFIYGLKKSGIEMNRKALSELAIADPEAFKVLVETAKKAL